MSLVRDPYYVYKKQMRELSTGMGKTQTFICSFDSAEAVDFDTYMDINLRFYLLLEAVREHNKDDIETLFFRAGLGEDGLPIWFSPWSWALAHPIRQNYIFQLHPGKDVNLCFQKCISESTKPS